METFFQELKQAREAKKLTLSDISDVTLIGVHFLEAIEGGNTAILPQTYVRAFIREYATVVGLDPNDVMRKYDTMLQGLAGPSEVRQKPEVERAPLPVTAKPEERSDRILLTQKVARRAMLTMIVLAVALLIWNMIGRQPTGLQQEIPFQNVVKENEKLATPPSNPLIAAGQPATTPVKTDSLLLRGLTTDSVWVQLVVDHQPPREFLFRPNTRILWKAAERFSLTLGNGGAIQFTLNQKDIGTLGKKGSVVRNVELTRQSLKAR